MLARTVNAREGLFVKQTDKAVTLCNALHALHRELVLVGCDVDACVYRRKFVLCGSHFVMLGIGINSELLELVVKLRHERFDTRLDCAVIMVAQLLSLRRTCAEKSPAGIYKIFTAIETAFVDKEILLFRADRGNNTFGFDSEQLQNPLRLSRHKSG